MTTSLSHRLARGASLLVACAMLPSATATAASLKVSATPASGGSPQQERPLTVDFSVSLDDAPTPTAITMLLTRGLQVNTALFPSCTAARIQARGAAGCPADSLIGTGSAVGRAGPAEAKLKLTLFNGPDLGQLLMLVSSKVPLEINSVIQSRVVEGDGSSPLGLRFDMPAELIEPLPGLKSSLPQFRVKVGKTITLGGRKVHGRVVGGRKVGYFSRVGCPGGSSRWAARVERPDGPQLLSTSIRCR